MCKDCELAVAAAYQRAADQVRAASERCEEQARGFGGMEGRERQFWEWTARSLALLQEATAILALAPAEALAEVQALKAERDHGYRLLANADRDAARAALTTPEKG